MKILHYALGFPPYRKGGMTMYCLDLMKYQVANNEEVAMMWPGRYLLSSNDSKIIQNKKKIVDDNKYVLSYELKNPALVPLIDGISEPIKFMKEKSIESFIKFFKENKFDVFHIHTLMGLPMECIDAAKTLNIKIIFTTHDYYGLCPNCSFMIGNNVCNDDNNCLNCIKCNQSALSVKKIVLLQSPLYRKIKDIKIVKYLRKRHIKDINEKYKLVDNIKLDKKDLEAKSKEYRLLREYYISMLKKIDFIHYNSENTKIIYEKYIGTTKKSSVISITNSSICDNKKLRVYNDNVRLGYLGPITFRKGFYDLINKVNILYNKNHKNFKLHIYDHYNEKIDYLIQNEPYNHGELSKVMDEFDVLVVPSLCDTFGFTVLEALSYGVPVIVSKYVGAKDLLETNKVGIIYDSLDELEAILIDIIKNGKFKLSKMNKDIFYNVKIKNFKEHSEEIRNLYLKLIKEKYDNE